MENQFTTIQLPSTPVTLVTASTSTPHVFLIKEALIGLIVDPTTPPHLRSMLSSQPKLSEAFSHEYFHTMYSSGDSIALPHLVAIVQHFLKFPAIIVAITQKAASVIDNGSISVSEVGAVLYRMAGCLRLEGSTFYPIVIPFNFTKLPIELQMMVLKSYFAIQSDYSCLTSPLQLVRNQEFRSLAKACFDKVSYEVNSGNFAEFMTLDMSKVLKVSHLRLTWVTTWVFRQSGAHYNSIRDRVNDFRTKGATMESHNNLKSIILDVSQDLNGCANYLRTMADMILAPGSGISSVTAIFQATDSEFWRVRRSYLPRTIIRQLGFSPTWFKNVDKNLWAIQWVGNAAQMKASVKRNAS